MNPIFYILVIVALFTIWVMLSMLFPIVGRVIRAIYKEVKHNLKRN